MKDWLQSIFKISEWITTYSKSDFSGDLKAGATAGIMLIPQGMAYAVIAGVPPIYGLYAGVIPLLIFPLFTSSRHLSVGPVAIDMLVVAAGIGAVTASLGTDAIGLVILLTMMTGILQFLMGAFRLGSLFNIFSRPVITGFIMAAPIIITLTQLDNLFGVELSGTQNVIFVLLEFFSAIDTVHMATLFWGISAIGVLLLFKKLSPSLPGSVILLIAGTAVAWFTSIESQEVDIVGSIPGGLPPITFPDMSYTSFTALIPAALTLALVQFMTITSLGQIFAKRHGYIADSNQELISIGSANFAGSLFSSLPVSASFSRSAASEEAGAKTAMTNIFAAVIIISTLLFLTPVFYYLPMPILAAIIIVSVFGLIDIEEAKFLARTKKSEGGIAVFTFISTLLIGIQEGILLGVGASMLLMVYRSSRPNIAELGLMPHTQSYKNLERNSEAVQIRGILLLRLDASFSFMNAEFFRDFILRKSEAQNKETKYVIIDGSSINIMDTTAIDSIVSIIKILHKWDMELYLAGLKGPVRDIVARSGLDEYLGKDHFCRTPHEAVKKILSIMDEKDDGDRSGEYDDLSKP